MATPYDPEYEQMRAMNTSQFGENYYANERDNYQPTLPRQQPMPSFEVYQAQFEAFRRFLAQNPQSQMKFPEFQKNYKPDINIQQAGSYKQKYLKYKQKYLKLKNN